MKTKKLINGEWVELPPMKKAPVRLGQTVAWAIKPVVRLADNTFGTDLEHCIGCGRRSEQLDIFGDAIYNWITR